MTSDPIYSSSQPVVAVVGATGLVGQVLLQVLAQRHFPVSRLVPMAGPRSVGQRLVFRGQTWTVLPASAQGFVGVDLVFFAATGELSRELAPTALAAGARVIDKSATWRMHPEVPLVVPEVNGGLIDANTRQVSSPNCTTTGLVMALEPLHRAAGLRSVQVTTLQAASGAGRLALEELESQNADLVHGNPLRNSFWPRPLAGNALPVCDRLELDGTSLEERKLLEETRKIMGLPELGMVATCTRVPVAVGHGAAVWVDLERELSVGEASTALGDFPGVRVMEQPTALDVVDQDEVLVGRIRQPLSGPGIQFWQVSDNLRKGAATNAVQIAECMLQQN